MLRDKASLGLCGRRVCKRLCVRVEHCDVGQLRVKNLWGNRKIARFKPNQLKLFNWDYSSIDKLL